MSAMTVYWLIAAVLILAAVFFTFALCRVSAACDAVDESRGRVWDEERGLWVRLPYGTKPGPGQLTEAEVASLDRFQVALDDIVTDPQWTAGQARLLNTIHNDHEQEGDQ